MQYFTLRIFNVSNIPRSTLKLIDVFPLFLEQIAVFPSYKALICYI